MKMIKYVVNVKDPEIRRDLKYLMEDAARVGFFDDWYNDFAEYYGPIIPEEKYLDSIENSVKQRRKYLAIQLESIESKIKTFQEEKDKLTRELDSFRYALRSIDRAKSNNENHKETL